MKNNLEKRMYFLVLYSLSGIQQAIQAGHAALEYAHKYGNTPEYIDFIENYKTWIILNGGTTNSKTRLSTAREIDDGALDETPLGTMNQHYLSILMFNAQYMDFEIKHATFKEPDLNDALTAICLVVDERVFNREDYPDFYDWSKEYEDEIKYRNWGVEKLIEKYKADCKVTDEIHFLKELLNTKRLA